jgi:uncharacterized membrane protein
MIYLSILTMIVGGILVFVGAATRRGSEMLIKFNKEKIGDMDSAQRFMGNNIIVLGFIGLIAGSATLAGGEDNILLFLGYLAFIFLFIALLKVGLKTFETNK